MKAIPRYRSDGIFSGADKAFWVNYPVVVNHFVPTHDHDFAEIVIIRGGAGWHLSIYGEEKLQPGSCLILLPGTWHGFRVPEKLEIVNCCFRPDLLAQELTIAELDPALQGLFDPVTGKALSGAAFRESRGPVHFHLDAGALTRALANCDALFQLQELPGAPLRLERRGQFLILLSLIARCLPADARKLWESAVLWPDAVRETIRFLEADLTAPWTLPGLASRVHLEPTYLGRLFKRHVDETPFEYLQRRRMERAAALLLRTNLSATEIAGQTGYESLPHFSRTFRRYHGQSPQHYRRNRKVPEGKPRYPKQAAAG